ncbi:MAG: glycosyltransferase family 9 protein [Saprospiraceae bacterium]|nr:glycosyltransferase family 9 protein [Saprospiraceae bacterium]
MPFRKILIIRFSSIGDIILTTPVIRCLKNQTKAEIHYLVKPAFAHVIHENPYIDRIHRLKDNIQDTIEELKNIGFDLIIDLHKNLRSIRISQTLGIKTIKYDKLNVSKWLAVNLKINKLPVGKHIVDRYFEAMSDLGIKDDGDGLDYFIMPEDEYDAQDLIKGVSEYQVLVLGATYFTKRIPKEKCIDIIALYKHPTILLGGKDVHDLAHEIAELFPKKVINFTGKIGLGVSAGIIKHASLVVSGDTGLMHIAAALQKELIVLWGNTIPEFGMYPFYGYNHPDSHTDYQVKDLSCRPCSKLGFDHCPKGHFKCMMDIKII